MLFDPYHLNRRQDADNLVPRAVKGGRLAGRPPMQTGGLRRFSAVPTPSVTPPAEVGVSPAGGPASGQVHRSEHAELPAGDCGRATRAPSRTPDASLVQSGNDERSRNTFVERGESRPVRLRQVTGQEIHGKLASSLRTAPVVRGCWSSRPAKIVAPVCGQRTSCGELEGGVARIAWRRRQSGSLVSSLRARAPYLSSFLVTALEGNCHHNRQYRIGRAARLSTVSGRQHPRQPDSYSRSSRRTRSSAHMTVALAFPTIPSTSILLVASGACGCSRWP